MDSNSIQLALIEQLYDDCELEIEHLTERLERAKQKLNLYTNLIRDLDYHTPI